MAAFWGEAEFEVSGYVTVLAGWGGAYPLVMGEAGLQQGEVGTVSRVLTFKLGGTASLWWI